VSHLAKPYLLTGDFTVFGAQYPIDQIGDCVLGPIAGHFDDLICAQLHFVSLLLCYAHNAAITIAGIELAHRIHKRQFSFGVGRPRRDRSLKALWDRALA
jgi:hypothetical protein